MEILGIGAPELVFVIIIALIILGPKDMQKAGRTIGRWLNQLVTSDGWKAFQQTSREIRNLPTNLMRQANTELAETEKEIRKATYFRIPPGAPPGRVPPQPKENPAQSGLSATTTPDQQTAEKPTAGEGDRSNEVQNTIAPPDSNPLESQGDTELTAGDGAVANEAGNPDRSEPRSGNLTASQDASEPNTRGDAEKKTDVNTTDHDA